MTNQSKTCCTTMETHLKWKCDQHANPDDCPDCIVRSYGSGGQYGIPIHDGGSSFIRIDYCPWCGAFLESVCAAKTP